MNKTLLLGLLCSSLMVCPIGAQEQRWFEIEMVVFTQTPEQSLQEQFAEQVTPIKPGRAFDLLTPLFQPNIAQLLKTLPLCDAISSFDANYGFNLVLPEKLCIHEVQPEIWQQANLFEPRAINDRLPYPDKIPSLITGNGVHQTTPYLAEESALQFNDIVSKLKRQRNKQVLLHTSWRQAPVTERLAIASRWFAGQNYTEQYDYWGQPVAIDEHSDNFNQFANEQYSVNQETAITADNQLLNDIDVLLEQLSANGQLTITDNPSLSEDDIGDELTKRNLPTEVWQLDGLFKLHLDHYLFVNTEFNLRIPRSDKMQTIYVRQSRRVISGEIHYLDHPYLGIILQIRRYEPAQQENEDSETEIMPLTD